MLGFACAPAVFLNAVLARAFPRGFDVVQSSERVLRATEEDPQ